MKSKLLIILFFCLVNLLLCEICTAGEDTVRSISVDEFIRVAAKCDTEFEAILIDSLALAYERDLALPARDIVFSVRGGYDLFLNQDREKEEVQVGLSKLFPLIGTELIAEYSAASSFTSNDRISELTFELVEPIAKNAFGRSTRLLDKITGIEVDIARHQIVEAYEEYFAVLIDAYYDWYEAYENLAVAKSSYNENLKLLDNIKERQKSKIALDVDVNKTHLQVFAKEESLTVYEEEYLKTKNVIVTAMRFDENYEIVPVNPVRYSEIAVSFKNDFAAFYEQGRTFEILRMLEEKSELDVSRSADDLLPSIDLKIGCTFKGSEYELEDKDSMLYAAVEMEYPFMHQTDKAELEVDKIMFNKRKLNTKNVYYQLYTDLRNLALAVQREQKLIDIAKQKIVLAETVLNDETENYTYGKVSLNDYIDAVNELDKTRFNRISHEVYLKKLVLEWLRITDCLVKKNDVY